MGIVAFSPPEPLKMRPYLPPAPFFGSAPASALNSDSYVIGVGAPTAQRVSADLEQHERGRAWVVA